MQAPAAKVAPRKSQNCQSMSERLRKPKAAPLLRTLTMSKKPGTTVMTLSSVMCFTIHHLEA